MINNLMNITPYNEINIILQDMANAIQPILGNNLLGLYLFGSLSYGDFNLNSSDIDLVAITKNTLTAHELQQIKTFHFNLAQRYKKWSERLECSYTPIDMLSNLKPPREPRPYYGGGIFYDEADYGNEWIINNYLLYKHGISLIGPDFKALLQPINIIEVQKACIRDLFKEWEPKITDPEWLEDSHYQSYIVMNLCRILYTVRCTEAGTKKTAANWVKNKYGTWRQLIGAAENWEYGKEMKMKNQTIEFIKFTIDQVKANELYQQMKINEN